jgi:hypothetical protein
VDQREEPGASESGCGNRRPQSRVRGGLARRASASLAGGQNSISRIDLSSRLRFPTQARSGRSSSRVRRAAGTAETLSANTSSRARAFSRVSDFPVSAVSANLVASVPRQAAFLHARPLFRRCSERVRRLKARTLREWRSAGARSRETALSARSARASGCGNQRSLTSRRREPLDLHASLNTLSTAVKRRRSCAGVATTSRPDG